MTSPGKRGQLGEGVAPSTFSLRLKGSPMVCLIAHHSWDQSLHAQAQSTPEHLLQAGRQAEAPLCRLPSRGARPAEACCTGVEWGGGSGTHPPSSPEGRHAGSGASARAAAAQRPPPHTWSARAAPGIRGRGYSVQRGVAAEQPISAPRERERESFPTRGRPNTSGSALKRTWRHRVWELERLPDRVFRRRKRKR